MCFHYACTIQSIVKTAGSPFVLQLHNVRLGYVKEEDGLTITFELGSVKLNVFFLAVAVTPVSACLEQGGGCPLQKGPQLPPCPSLPGSNSAPGQTCGDAFRLPSCPATPGQGSCAACQHLALMGLWSQAEHQPLRHCWAWQLLAFLQSWALRGMLCLSSHCKKQHSCCCLREEVGVLGCDSVAVGAPVIDQLEAGCEVILSEGCDG